MLFRSHYANNKGFVIEYDYKNFKENFFQGPFQINYSQDINPASITTGKTLEAFLFQTNVKKAIWCYESEWRLIACKKEAMHLPGIGENDKIKNDRKFYFKNRVLSITLGSNFFDIHNESEWILPLLKENDKIHIVVSDKKLRVINYAVDNNLDIFWIIQPELNASSNFNLQRRKIELNRISENEFTLTNFRF